MAVTIPDWLRPVMELYELPWPDIDEDAVAALGDDLMTLGTQVYVFGLGVHSALRDLAQECDAELLDNLSELSQEALTQYLQPISDAGMVAHQVFADAGMAIYGWKMAMFGALDVCVGATLLSGGALLAAKEVGAKVAEAAVLEIMRDAEQWLLTWRHAQVERLVVEPISREVDGVVQRVVRPVAQEVERMAEGLHVDRGQARLVVDATHLVTTANRLDTTLSHVEQAVAHLLTEHESRSYLTPCSRPDPLLREIVKGVADHVVHTLHDDLTDMVRQVVGHLTGALTTFGERLEAADRALAGESSDAALA